MPPKHVMNSAKNSKRLLCPTVPYGRRKVIFETFYGLHHSPFSRDIPTSELYPSVVLEETLGRLEYAAQRQWFAVVTGDCGTGKTTTIRRFTKVLDQAKYKVLYLSDSKLTPRHFYKGLLEEVRFLLNFKMDAQSPMPLILVGQSELWDRLGLQAYAAIRQRIDLQCKLPYYDRAQIGEYIKRHLTYAGTENEIFSDGAIEEIYRFSSGSARLVN